MIALCWIIVALAASVIFASAAIVWVVLGRAVQAARFEADLTMQAMKIQALIDERVERRLTVARVDSTGKLVAFPQAPGLGRIPAQPPDPNVRMTSILDDVHENERELSRMIGDADFTARDGFASSQPMEA